MSKVLYNGSLVNKNDYDKIIEMNKRFIFGDENNKEWNGNFASAAAVDQSNVENNELTIGESRAICQGFITGNHGIKDIFEPRLSEKYKIVQLKELNNSTIKKIIFLSSKVREIKQIEDSKGIKRLFYNCLKDESTKTVPLNDYVGIVRNDEEASIDSDGIARYILFVNNDNKCTGFELDDDFCLFGESNKVTKVITTAYNDIERNKYNVIKTGEHYLICKLHEVAVSNVSYDDLIGSYIGVYQSESKINGSYWDIKKIEKKYPEYPLLGVSVSGNESGYYYWDVTCRKIGKGKTTDVFIEKPNDVNFPSDLIKKIQGNKEFIENYLITDSEDEGHKDGKEGYYSWIYPKNDQLYSYYRKYPNKRVTLGEETGLVSQKVRESGKISYIYSTYGSYNSDFTNDDYDKYTEEGKAEINPGDVLIQMELAAPSNVISAAYIDYLNGGYLYFRNKTKSTSLEEPGSYVKFKKISSNKYKLCYFGNEDNTNSNFVGNKITIGHFIGTEINFNLEIRKALQVYFSNGEAEINEKGEVIISEKIKDSIFGSSDFLRAEKFKIDSHYIDFEWLKSFGSKSKYDYSVRTVYNLLDNIYKEHNGNSTAKGISQNQFNYLVYRYDKDNNFSEEIINFFKSGSHNFDDIYNSSNDEFKIIGSNDHVISTSEINYNTYSDFYVFNFKCIALRKYNVLYSASLSNGNGVYGGKSSYKDGSRYLTPNNPNYLIVQVLDSKKMLTRNLQATQADDIAFNQQENFIRSWRIVNDTQTNSDARPNLIGVERYYDFYTGMTPYVKLSFRNSFEGYTVENGGLKNKSGEYVVIPSTNGKYKINGGEEITKEELVTCLSGNGNKVVKGLDNWIDIDTIKYPYIKNFSLKDNGVKTLNLTLFDPDFASYSHKNEYGVSMSLERILRGALNPPGDIINKLLNSTNKDEYYEGDDLSGQFLKLQKRIKMSPTNLRVRFGYADRNQTLTDNQRENIFGSKKRDARWYEYRYDSDSLANLNTYKVKKYIKNGQIVEADDLEPVESIGQINTKRSENSLKTGLKRDTSIQTTKISTIVDFMITGFSTTLKDTGIEYNITAIETKEAELVTTRFLQRYANLHGTPTAILYSLMRLFNEDDEGKAIDTGVKILMMEDNFVEGSSNPCRINMRFDKKKIEEKNFADFPYEDTFICEQEGISNLDISKVEECDLSLGGEAAKTNYLKDTKNPRLYKNVSELISSFCSMCPPKKIIDSIPKDLVDEDGNQIVAKSSVNINRPLKWFSFKAEDGETYICLYYRTPNKLNNIRLYTWGPRDYKNNVIKSVNIKNANEFAILSSITTFSELGQKEIKSTDGESADVTVIEDKESKVNKVNIAGVDAKAYSEAFNNCMYSGDITILGDPFYLFDGCIQPCTYPIKLDITIPKSEYELNVGVKDAYKRDVYCKGQQLHEMSGYYVIQEIEHTISTSGFTTKLKVMRYPNIENSIFSKDKDGNLLLPVKAEELYSLKT